MILPTTLLSRSINSADRSGTAGRQACIGWRGAAILASILLASGGCAKQQAEAPSPPKRAYVRLAALTARHPLQGEVRLLRETEGRLRSLVGVPRQRPTVDSLSLPALPETRVREDLVKAATERRTTMRERVERAAQRQMRGFADISANRLDRLNEQRRAELLALLASDYETRIQSERDVIFARVREQLADLLELKVVLRSRLAVLRAQLEPDAPIPLPVLDAAELNAEIAKLDADPNATGISQRARLERQRRAELAKLEEVNEKIRAALEQGDRDIAAMTDRIKAELDAEVRRRLALGQQATDFERDLREQQRILAAALDEEAQIARDTLREAQSVGQGEGLRPADLDRLFGPVRAVPTDPRGAAERLAAQRATLERYIETSVAESVRDAARNRNVDVLLVRGTEPAPAQIPGRVDLTGEFMRWIDAGGSPPGVSGGAGS